MKPARSLVLACLLVALPALLLAEGGCRKIKSKVGLGTTIEEAEPGSPEATIQAAFRAALVPREEDAWEQFRPLLHSREIKSPQGEIEWRTMRFPRLRRQVDLYVRDPERASFKLMNERELDDGTIELYVDNNKSDLPTPCAVQKDADGAWRITRCSL